MYTNYFGTHRLFTSKEWQVCVSHSSPNHAPHFQSFEFSLLHNPCFSHYLQPPFITQLCTLHLPLHSPPPQILPPHSHKVRQRLLSPQGSQIWERGNAKEGRVTPSDMSWSHPPFIRFAFESSSGVPNLRSLNTSVLLMKRLNDTLAVSSGVPNLRGGVDTKELARHNLVRQLLL